MDTRIVSLYKTAVPFLFILVLALADPNGQQLSVVDVSPDGETRGSSVKPESVDFSSNLPIFQPSADGEWKEVLPGQHIPGGLDVRMNIQTGQKWARKMKEKRPEELKKDEEREKRSEQIAVPEVADSYAVPPNITDLPEMDDGMKSAKMIERVLGALPEPPQELRKAQKEIDPERYKAAMKLLWEKRQKELHEAKDAIHDSADAMQKGTSLLLDTNSSDIEKVEVLQSMEQEVMQLDNAMDFATIGGLAAVVNLLDHKSIEVRKHAAWVVGTAVKNYREVQDAARELGAIDTFLNVLEEESRKLSQGSSNTDYDANELEQRIELLGKQIYGLGATVRGSLEAENHLFAQLGGNTIAVLLQNVFYALQHGPAKRIQGPITVTGTVAWTPETLIIKRKLCGAQNKLIAFVEDVLTHAIHAVGVLGGQETSNGADGVTVVKQLTSLDWCDLLVKIMSELPCGDDVSREKTMKTYSTILMVEERLSKIRGKPVNKCLAKGKASADLKTALSIWRKDWEDAVLEDPEDDYARDLIGMVDKLVKKLL